MRVHVLTQDSGDSTQDSGDSTHNSGDSTHNSGDSTQDSGHSTHNSGDSTQDSGHKIVVTQHVGNMCHVRVKCACAAYARQCTNKRACSFMTLPFEPYVRVYEEEDTCRLWACSFMTRTLSRTSHEPSHEPSLAHS